MADWRLVKIALSSIKESLMFQRERTLVVLFVLLQQIAAHITILKHLLKLCRECGPALLHAELRGGWGGGGLNKERD
jgi:hypothetical protein